VFGDWALDIEQSAQGAAQAVGLSTSAYENLASVIGAQLKGAGMPIDEVTAKTQDLVTMGADLAATFGGSTADAVAALSSTLKGEFDPIERYGVSLKQSDINARLAALGQDQLTGAALKTATAQAALGLITDATRDAQGAFARESDTAAGATQRLSAMWDNAQAALGQRLLPVVTAVANFLMGTVLPVIGQWTAQGGALQVAWSAVSDFVTGQLMPAVMGLWQVIGPQLTPILATAASVVTGTLVPAFRAIWQIVQTYVFPIIASVLTPALAGLRSAWDTVARALEDNRGKFQAIYQNIQPFLAFLRDHLAPFVGGVLATQFRILGTAVSFAIGFFSRLLEVASRVVGVVGKVGNFVGGLFGAPSPAGAVLGAAPGLFGATATGGLFAAASSLGGGGTSPSAAAGGSRLLGGDTYQITVTGALDPVAVADQIGKLLDRRARRTGRAVAGSFA
jgi:MFS family permease